METDITIRNVTWNKCKLATNIIVLFVLLLLVLYISYISFISYHYLFTWHVVFGTISYLFLMPNSLLIFDNVWLLKYTRKQKSMYHGIIASSATAFTIICIYCEYYRKEIYKDQYQLIHFQTPHAIFGLLSLLVLFIGSISGLSALNITWFIEKCKIIRPVTLKLCHNFLGQAAFILGVICICIVIHDAWFIYYTTTSVRIILTVLISFVTLVTLINSIFNGFYQINNVINE